MAEVQAHADTAHTPKPVKEPDNTDPLLDYVKTKSRGGAALEAKRVVGGKATVEGVDIPSGGYLVKITLPEKKPETKGADTKHPDVLPPDEQKKILAAFQDRFVEAGQSEAHKELVAEPRVVYVGMTAAAFDALFELEVPPTPVEGTPKK